MAVLALMVTATVGAFAPLARAEPVLTLGPGVGAPSAPTAVADAAGTLHALWRNVDPSYRPVFYCRVPAGGTGCTPVEIMRNGSGRPALLIRPQDGALIALVPRYVDGKSALWLAISADGGASWSAPAPVATGLDGVDDAALTPDGTAIDIVASGVRFQRVPLAGGETRVVSLGGRVGSSASISHLSDGRPIVAGEFDVYDVRTRVGAAGLDPNTPGAWARKDWRPILGIGQSALDSGPTGSWLLTRDAKVRGNDWFVRLWRWGPGGFALARRVGALNRPQSQPIGLAQSDSQIALDVDLAGRLHAVWAGNSRRCGQNCLVYRRTDRGGFGPLVTYPVGTAKILDRPTDIVAAANSGGSGWIVWRAGDNIRAVPLVTPPRGARVGSLRIGSRRVSIPDFYACAPPGGAFVHRLNVDGRRGRTRIDSVRFFFDDGQPTGTDNRSPWRMAFPLTFASGTRHVAGAVVTYRIAGGSLRTVTIGRTFVMC